MIATTKPLLDLTAEDLMSRDVIAISRHTSLREAAHTLAQANVSGAPVTDERGRCVGVLSSTDLVRWLDGPEQAIRRRFTSTRCFCSDWEVMEFEALPDEAVGRYMTADPVTTRPDARLGELARRMLDAHIHRLFVLDEEGRPVGIVSTTDVLAAVAHEALVAGQF
jgi:CBS-domain-containing membrane protein